jgi:hypothetical protein
MNSEKCIIETRVGANPDIPSSINLFIMWYGNESILCNMVASNISYS